MKFIPLLVVMLLTGCAASMSELLTEAKECTSTSINPQGIIGKPTADQSKTCWQKVNNKTEAIAKREAEKELEKANACPKGTTKVCSKRQGGRTSRKDPRDCSCWNNYAVRRIFLGRY